MKFENPLRMLCVGLLCFTIIAFTRLSFGRAGSLDEGIYFAVSYQVSQGKLLYSEVLESKGPLFFFVNAFVLNIVGPSVLYLRTFYSFILSLAALCVYQIARLYHRSWRVGFFGALAFSALVSLPAFQVYFVLTEPLMVFFQSLILLQLSYLLKYNPPRTSAIFALGSSLALLMMVRQSAAIFFILTLALILYILMTRRNMRGIMWLTVGICAAVLPLILYYYASNSFQALLHWLLYEPVLHAAIVAPVQLELKLSYFTDVLVSISPALILVSIGAMFRRSHYPKPFVTLIVVWLAAIPTLYLCVPFFPAFQHEYLELTLPISFLFACGVAETIRLMSRFLVDGQRYKGISVIAVSCLLISSTVYMSAQQVQNDISYSYVSNDLELVDMIGDYMKDCLSSSDKVYVYETYWPKISMYVYPTLGRFPIGRSHFFFPPEMDESMSQHVIWQINVSKYVILIGNRPPFNQARRVYDFILTHFRRITYLGKYSPYSWLQNQSVYLFKKTSHFDIQPEAVAFETFAAPPTGTYVELAGTQASLTIKYQTTSDNWFSIIFKPNTTLSLSADKCVSFSLSKAVGTAIIQMDIVDSFDNFSRIEFETSHTENSNFTIWFDASMFIPVRGIPSLSQIESINLTFVFPVGRGDSFQITDFQLGTA